MQTTPINEDDVQTPSPGPERRELDLTERWTGNAKELAGILRTMAGEEADPTVSRHLGAAATALALAWNSRCTRKGAPEMKVEV